MKRIIALVLVLISFISLPAFSEEWLSIPKYGTFMERLCEFSETSLAANIRANYFENGLWQQSGSLNDTRITGSYGVEFEPEGAQGYLDELEIRIYVDSYSLYADDFHKLIKGAMLSLNRDWTQEDIERMYSNLAVETILQTNVSHMSQHSRQDLYRYSFGKTKGYKEYYYFTIKLTMFD